MTSWISPYEPVRAPAGSRPTHLLRTTFRATGRGTLRITAHGVYEAHLNGHRVGDHELTRSHPGYERFELRPVPGPLTHAHGALDTRHGRIESSWTIDDGAFILDAVVPEGTTCLATLPDGSTRELTPGHHNLRSTT